MTLPHASAFPIPSLTIMLPPFISAYFSGELHESLVFILPIGLLCLVFGVWLLLDTPTSFTRGVAIPFVAMGLVMTLVGGGVGFRTPSQVRRLEAGLQTAAVPTMAAEVKRVASVNVRWRLYLWGWAAFGVVGLLCRFALQHPGARGFGTALVFFSGVGLLVDGFAERRAHVYAEALAAWSPGGQPPRPDVAPVELGRSP